MGPGWISSNSRIWERWVAGADGACEGSSISSIATPLGCGCFLGTGIPGNSSFAGTLVTNPKRLPKCRGRRAMGYAEGWKGFRWKLSGGIRWDVLFPIGFWDEEPSIWSPGRGCKRKGDLEPSPGHPQDPQGPQCGWEKEQKGLWVGRRGGLCRAPPCSAPRFSPHSHSQGCPSPLGVS